MNKIEEFYKEAGGIEYDKFDKKADKFTYYDMIGFADAYHSKQLIIADVSQRSELLAFLDWHYEEDIADQKTKETIVDTYLSKS